MKSYCIRSQCKSLCLIVSALLSDVRYRIFDTLQLFIVKSTNVDF